MIEELQKVATLPLEESAYLRPISGKGIGFYNLDKNTAQFQFRVTKDNFPLLLSNQNIKGYAFFKENVTKKGVKPSISGVLDIDSIDPMKGIIGVTVPSWFLKNVANSNVLGEVYLSLNDVKNEGNDDTVVLGTFAFDVRDSLVNQISSDIKVSYIRMFDDLRTELELKVQQLKEDIGDVTSLIESIKQIANDTLSKINKAQADAISAITDALLSSTNSIDLERDEALRQIDAKRDAVKTDYDLASDTFNKLANDSTQVFNDTLSKANQTIDDKVNNFNQTLANNGFVKPIDVDNKLSTLTWQKYKLTNDDGTRIRLNGNGADISTLNAGQYQIYNYIGMPTNEGDMNSYWNVDVTTGTDNVKQIIATLSYKNKQFIKMIHKGQDLGWKLLTNDVIDTGWVDLPLINGVIPYGTTYRPVYRLINENGLNKLYLKGAVKNIASKNVAIANLPTNITSLVTSNMPFPQIGSNKGSISTLIRWSVTVNGAIQIDGSSMDTSQMSPDDFYPINTSMLL